MSRVAAFFLLAVALLAADASWNKVKELKSHSELRIYKRGARQPVNATFDDATEDRVIVVVKNKQMSISKDDIDRVEARPPKAPRKLNVESSARETPPDPVPHPIGGPAVPGTSASSNVGVSGGNQGNFELVYQRPEAAPKK